MKTCTGCNILYFNICNTLSNLVYFQIFGQHGHPFLCFIFLFKILRKILYTILCNILWTILKNILKYLRKGLFPSFLISCAVSADHEEVNVWWGSDGRSISHKEGFQEIQWWVQLGKIVLLEHLAVLKKPDVAPWC